MCMLKRKKLSHQLCHYNNNHHHHNNNDFISLSISYQL